MTENMKIWLKRYIDEHLGTASNEHLWALGAPNAESACLHEQNSEEHIAFATLLKSLLEKEVK